MSEFLDVVERIHAAPQQGVFIVTGGGSRLLSELLTVAGASNTVLEARVPYAATALHELLGAIPDQACSAETACAMAMAGYQRANQLHETTRAPLFGFALSASLRTGRTRRGPHRVHLAMQTRASTFHWHLQLERDSRSRDEEEALVTALALRCLCEGLALPLDRDLTLHAREAVTAEHVEAPKPWREVLDGRLEATPAHGQHPRPTLLFPGAFNPLHNGHLGMARYAGALKGGPVSYEICLNNVDKPPLNYLTLQHRTAQFDPDAQLWLSNRATFLDKARTFPGVEFIVGIDTLVRIADPHYYGDDASQRDEALTELAELEARFLVFGRTQDDGFKTASDYPLPEVLLRRCEVVDEQAFREDVSSSVIRANTGPPTRT